MVPSRRLLCPLVYTKVFVSESKEISAMIFRQTAGVVLFEVERQSDVHIGRSQGHFISGGFMTEMHEAMAPVTGSLTATRPVLRNNFTLTTKATKIIG